MIKEIMMEIKASKSFYCLGGGYSLILDIVTLNMHVLHLMTLG